MSDDFGTISARRGGRSHDVEAIRAHYRRHRDALMSLVSDAPTELIAADYRRVIADIDIALAKLDTIEGTATGAGMRPLVMPGSPADEATVTDYVTEGSDSSSRLVLIVGAALIALVAIGWLIWKASDRAEPAAAVEAPATTTTIAEEAPVAPASAARVLVVSPDSIDYGVLRKGTRATRQYEIVNNSDEPVSIQLSRSVCRCLYYEHAPVVPPRGKETLTVTIDGAKAAAGPLLESVKVSSKADPTVLTTFDVAATVR